MPRKVLTAAAPQPQQDTAIQVEVTLPLRQRRCEGGKTPSHQTRSTSSSPRIPRITRLMALAIKFQSMVDRGEVRDYADLARLGYVTRARLTQIMNLLLLAPDIQEAILDSSNAWCGRSTITERDLRSVSRIINWSDQRRLLNGIAEEIQPELNSVSTLVEARRVGSTGRRARHHRKMNHLQ